VAPGCAGPAILAFVASKARASKKIQKKDCFRFPTSVVGHKNHSKTVEIQQEPAMKQARQWIHSVAFFSARFLSNTKYYRGWAAHSNCAGVRNET
jgi:hypothetical protein